MVLKEYAAVQAWMDAVGFDDGDPRLEILSRFAQATSASPDQMIGECLRPIDNGQKKLSFKARRRWVEAIESFEQAHGGRPVGNVLRSFFVQNGVPIQSSILF